MLTGAVFIKSGSTIFKIPRLVLVKIFLIIFLDRVIKRSMFRWKVLGQYIAEPVAGFPWDLIVRRPTFPIF